MIRSSAAALRPFNRLTAPALPPTLPSGNALATRSPGDTSNLEPSDAYLGPGELPLHLRVGSMHVENFTRLSPGAAVRGLLGFARARALSTLLPRFPAG